MAEIPSTRTLPEASTRSAESEKKQPWRVIYPCIAAAVLTDGSSAIKKPTQSVAREWNHLERGLLPLQQENSLAKLIEEKFQGQVWYKGARPGRCSNCGNYPCVCQVFEGG